MASATDWRGGELMAERPGVMFYFDTMPAIKKMEPNDVYAVFMAGMEYGQFGVVPELDGVASIVWDLIKPKIDRDGEAYQKKVLQQTWKGYIRHIENEADRPTFDEWYEGIYLPQLATASQSKPNQPTITTTPNTTTTPGTKLFSKVDVDGEGDGEGCGERRGRTSPLKPLDGVSDAEAEFEKIRQRKIQELMATQNT